MASKTISQRITLEGTDDIEKQLLALGKAGAEAFKQIQDAAKKESIDPAKMDKLARQFSELSRAAGQYGTAGTQAAEQVTAGLERNQGAAEGVGAGFNGAAKAATDLGVRVGIVTGIVTAATTKLLSMVGAIKAALSPGALTEGAVASGKAIADQADKLNLTVEQYAELRKAAAVTGMSQEKLASALEHITKAAEAAHGGVARLADGTSVSTQKFGDNVVTIYQGASALKQTATEADKAAVELVKLGVPMATIAKGDVPGVLRSVADAIFNIKNEAERSKAGIAAFGADWESVVSILRAGVVTSNAVAKATRDMSAEQIEKASEVKKAWDDQADALRALKDHIGAIFFDSALLKAEWLTKLIDGSRKLLDTWLNLAQSKQDAFLKGLGDSPAEVLFKTLIAASTLLSSIWNQVLVPAGIKLMGIFKGVGNVLGGISVSQVAAGFGAFAIGILGLAVAFGVLEFALAPIMALFSPFGAVLAALGFTAALFWDQISEGASKAAALIPNELEQIKGAIASLFRGDFSAAWDQFSGAAVAAFAKLKAAAQEDEGLLGELFRGFQQIAKDLPGTIRGVGNALVELGNIATSIADKINAVFGTKLTGTDIAIGVLTLQLTGGFQALAAAATIAAAGVAIVGTAIVGLTAAFTPFLALIAPAAAPFAGLIVAIGLLGAALIAINWSSISAAAVTAWNAISTAISNSITWVGNFVSAMASIAWNSIMNAGVNAWNGITGAIKNAYDWAIKYFRASSSGGGGGEAEGHARGGLIGGRGSGTSDSNLAWVSRGEHIMPAYAVRQPGVLSFLEALRRSGGNLSRVLDGLGRYAAGGLVMPSLATASIGGGMSNVTIQFPGLPSIGGLRAPSQVVEELQRAAAMAQVRSGGRKPSRYR